MILLKSKQQDREDVELSRASELESDRGLLNYPLDLIPILALKACFSSSLPANIDIYRVYLQSSGQGLKACPIPPTIYKITLSEQGYSDNQLILPSLLRVGPISPGPSWSWAAWSLLRPTLSLFILTFHRHIHSPHVLIDHLCCSSCWGLAEG